MEVGSPKLLFENLDLTPIHSILWTGPYRYGPGRLVVYQPEWDLRALMLRQLEQIPYIRDLVKRLRRNPHLRNVCGYGDRAPCEAHFSQMKRWIGAEGFRIIEAWLRREALKLRNSQPLTAVDLVQAACIDSTNLPAWSSRDPHDTRRGLGDPDARVGRVVDIMHLAGSDEPPTAIHTLSSPAEEELGIKPEEKIGGTNGK